MGGSHPYEGRVEMYHDGQWGTICDSNWDLGDATVVCNQLGYFSAVRAVDGDQFGQGSGEIMLSNVGCFGWESSLLSCPHSGLYQNSNCDHSRDAGVICWHYTVGPTSEFTLCHFDWKCIFKYLALKTNIMQDRNTRKQEKECGKNIDKKSRRRKEGRTWIGGKDLIKNINK